MAIRVILAEDHIIIREGLRSLLYTYSDITVVGEERRMEGKQSGWHKNIHPMW